LGESRIRPYYYNILLPLSFFSVLFLDEKNHPGQILLMFSIAKLRRTKPGRKNKNSLVPRSNSLFFCSKIRQGFKPANFKKGKRWLFQLFNFNKKNWIKATPLTWQGRGHFVFDCGRLDTFRLSPEHSATYPLVRQAWNLKPET
jgi:hypothetical protein